MSHDGFKLLHICGYFFFLILLTFFFGGLGQLMVCDFINYFKESVIGFIYPITNGLFLFVL